MALAQCDTCKKKYQINDVEKKYRCKACGGLIQAVEEGVTCPKCKAYHSKKQIQFCDECGHSLGKEAASKTVTDKVEHGLATKKIRNALALMGHVRIFFIIGAIIYGGFFIIALLAAIHIQNRETGFMAIAATFITSVICALMILGAWKIYVYPFVFSLLLACFSTIELLPFLGSINLILIIKTVMVLLAWAAVVAAANMRKQLKKLPQMYISKRGKLCTHRDTEGKISKRLAQKADVSRKKRNMILMAIGIGVVAVIIIYVLILEISKPGPIIETADSFIREWNIKRDPESAASKIALFFDKKSHEKMSRQLGRRFKKFGWLKQRPTLLKNPDIKNEDVRRCEVMFSFKDPEIFEPLDTNWEYKERQWRLRSIRYPRNL